MISYLEGVIFEKNPDSLIIMVGGIGLKVFVTQSCLIRVEPGQKISLRTHLVVREDLLALYGFETQEDVRYFSLLMGVSGIGPRLALGILSSAGVDTIRRSVVQEQPDFLSRVPGVGKKTAQKIILYLQGKISGSGDGTDYSEFQAADFEVVEALTALGYSIVQAQAAVQALPKDTPNSIEEKLRVALQSLG
jgi:Holliday junction DNA helicase RuvA